MMKKEMIPIIMKQMMKQHKEIQKKAIKNIKLKLLKTI